MININNYEIFCANMSSMKKTSKDDANNEYMTESDTMVVNFDNVVKNFCKEKKISSVDSNDAMYLSDDGNITFIEFKNGFLDKKTRHKLLKKIYDSLLIFNDITGKNISYTRENISYILVYNEKKNNEQTNQKSKYCISESRDMIDKTLLGYGDEKYIKSGLEFLKGYCFKEVDTYTKSEFEELFVKKINQ